MKTIRHSITACLAVVLLMVLPASGALAEEDTATGVIREVSSDYRGLMINGAYYQLDSGTVVHAPGGDGFLSVDALSAGTQIGFRSGRTASGSVVPRVAEIWIYVD